MRSPSPASSRTPAASRVSSSSACTAWARRSTRRLLAELPDAACRVYAPVGGHRDLLAYLVRRLLENGANSSFVSVAADPSVPIADILRRPQSWIATPATARHPQIPLPRDLYRPERRNSAGIEFGDRASLDALLAEIRAGTIAHAEAAPLVDGIALPGIERAVHFADRRRRDRRGARGRRGDRAGGDGGGRGRASPPGRRRRCETRAAALERAADLLEANRRPLIALLQNEGGKTLDDALAECARRSITAAITRRRRARRSAPQALPGPTGESNVLALSRPRRVRLHQPVEFSAGDLPRPGRGGARRRQRRRGQAGRADAARSPRAPSRCCTRPACRRPRCISLPGDGAVGARLVADPRIAGVAFTGSTEVGRAINRALAAKERADRAADRRNRRHQRHDRRCHRAARAGDRRRGRVGLPLGRPALLGAAASVRAGATSPSRCWRCWPAPRAN